jgi:hypothetical protein
MHFQAKAEFMEPDLSWDDRKICRNCSAICPNAATCSRRKESGFDPVTQYSLWRCRALTPFLKDEQLPVDNNWIENQIRPIAIGKNNWLFAGSLRGGQIAAAAMSLIQSAKLNGHDPYAYLKDVLTRLPTHMNSRIEELLPHPWSPA